jgi:hypothetical protein
MKIILNMNMPSTLYCVISSSNVFTCCLSTLSQLQTLFIVDNGCVPAKLNADHFCGNRWLCFSGLYECLCSGTEHSQPSVGIVWLLREPDIPVGRAVTCYVTRLRC